MDFVTEIRTAYPYLSVEDAQRIVNRAKMYYYGRKYPYELDVDENKKPIVTFKDKMWILEACDELIERLGFSSALSYRENGISWTFDNTKLSRTLLSQIIPIAGGIK